MPSPLFFNFFPPKSLSETDEISYRERKTAQSFIPKTSGFSNKHFSCFDSRDLFRFSSEFPSSKLITFTLGRVSRASHFCKRSITLQELQAPNSLRSFLKKLDSCSKFSHSTKNPAKPPTSFHLLFSHLQPSLQA